MGVQIGAIRQREVKAMPALPPLDGLRASAILIVMLSHTALGKVVPGGTGVTIFFFLSGYLITTLLRIEAANTGRVSLRNFYYKRTLRIMPPMFLTIALVATLTVVKWIDHPLWPIGVLTDVAFLSNYPQLIGGWRGVYMPLWSLDVEEHYYILFSTLFALILAKVSSRRAAVVCVGLAAVPLLIRLGMAFRGADLSYVYYWTHTRLDSILWGSILALWQNPVVDDDAWKPKLWHFGLALGALAGCLALRNPVFRETLRYTIQGAALLVVFSYLLQARSILARALGSRPLRFIALISYTLYLAHMPAIAIAEHFKWHAPVITGLALAFLYAILMRAIVEKPLQALRRSRH